MTIAPFDLSAVVTAIISSINMAVTIKLSHDQKDHSEKLNKIDSQVSNDHAKSDTPNLRVDLDKKFSVLNGRMDALSSKVGIIQDNMLRLEKDFYDSIRRHDGNSH